ncbi:MAG: transcriptional regulator [Tepidiforma sp.]|jgi:Zn-dependent peptidase ImmA (M78 family)|uniref:helix-turn-helix domain-containing protein n=1 Tax=Tepidiforma sp. TaxID=2682230 RepID=UPI0021DC03B3|nr:ImmA/IrrE family metallo-endopeptidase [Tepidiforma sp.]GIW15658.1 MAG: transcriptional regulator [Tepidiforma sp.]
MPTFNYQRLDVARRYRGLGKGELAAGAGITLRQLNHYQHGEDTPSEATLKRLSEVLQFPLSFFFGAEIDGPDVAAANFRSLRRMTARDRDRGLATGALGQLIFDWLEEKGFELPSEDIPALELFEPEEAAKFTRAQWGIGERPIGHMIRLVESKGVRVAAIPDAARELDAFSFWRGKTPYIFLNLSKSAERIRFDIAHELGHLVMHAGCGRTRESEFEANLFASAFLMPRGEMLASGLYNPRLSALIDAKARWGVSVAALAYRLHKVGMISDWHHEVLFREISIRGYRTDEPQPMRKEVSQLWERVYEVLRKDEGMSPGDIAAELAIPEADLRQMTFQLSPVGGAERPAWLPPEPDERVAPRIVARRG